MMNLMRLESDIKDEALLSTHSSRKRWTFDFVLSVLALGGLAAFLTTGLHVRTNADGMSDFKTVYASARCFIHGQDAYSIPNIQSVLAMLHITGPTNWYGHHPVYPPLTLALIAPLSFLPFTVAAYLITLLSTLALSAAVAGLLQKHTGHLEQTWGWKAVFVTLCASGPLLGFALSIGNLSVLAAALALLAFTSEPVGRRLWLAVAALSLAIILKPHLAIWVAIAMVLLPESQKRAVALKALSAIGMFLVVWVVGLSVNATLAMQWSSFCSSLHSEASPGSSMNISSHAVVPIEAQITSLQSLLGFWSDKNMAILFVSAVVLVLIATWLGRATLRARTEEQETLAVAAWVAFGCLATYHRAYDAIALLLLLPFLLYRLRKDVLDWRCWIIVGLYLIMSTGPSVEFVQRKVAHLPQYSPLAFVILRQIGIADVCMLMALSFSLRRELDSCSQHAVYRTFALGISPGMSDAASLYPRRSETGQRLR